MTRRGPSHTGPYGLACANCFKAKSKCTVRPGTAGACERCFRLSKDCHPSEAMRRSDAEKKKTPTARISELENKVESLLTQLQSHNTEDADGVEMDKVVTPPSRGQTRGTLSDEASLQLDPELFTPSEKQMQGNLEVQNDQLHHTTGAVQSDGSGRLNSDPAVIVEAIDGDTNAEDLLAIFRSQILCNFPFMHLPTQVTAQQIKIEWPTLFQAIVSVASGKGTTARSRRPHLKRVICDAMLDFDENPTNLKRMDLLLSIMTYMAWGCDHVLYRGSMPRLMLQAASLASEMMQTDTVDPEDRTRMEPTAWLFDHDDKRDPNDDTTRDFFLDRRRAILGCFVLSSAVSAYFGRVNVVRWTMQMEESLAVISMNKGCPTDKSFALHVRLQRLAENAVEIYRRQQVVFRKTVGETGSPAIISLLSIQTELQELQASILPNMPHMELCMAQSSSVELTLHEVTYAVTSALPSMIKHVDKMTGAISAGTIFDGTENAWTLRREQEATLWHCVQSSKACMMALAGFSPGNFCQISFIQWVQLARSIACLHHLTTTIEDPAWDNDIVRMHVDLPQLLDKVIDKLRLAAQLSGPENLENVFTCLVQKMREIKAGMSIGSMKQHETRQEDDGSEEPLRGDEGGSRSSPRGINKAAQPAKDGPWSFDYVLG